MTDIEAADKAAEQTKVEQNGEPEKTCFVVIGFGKKTDPATGRVLDLDKTYSRLIEPAFKAAGVRCFRAIDVNVSGSIDVLMYRWIYEADFVIADLSTMNVNVFYELGVRYAQKPNTTLIMAENGIFKKLPFDLSHTIIYGYEHGGDDIPEAEVKRFVPILTGQVNQLLKEPPASPGDSPVYTYLQGMKEPSWQDAATRIADLEAALAEKEKFTKQATAEEADPEAIKQAAESQAIAAVVEAAEAAKNREDFATAIALYNTAIEKAKEAAKPPPEVAEAAAGRKHAVKIDISLWQRLALVTYKQVEDNDREDPEANQQAVARLEEAMDILLEECFARTSTDPETLGLSGAVNKRLYARTDKRKYFERSVGYYERGFYIKQDYYNGINVAFMYTTDAARLAEEGDRFNAIVNYGHANIIRSKVAEICEDLTRDTTAFAGRDDKEWVYQTLAQAYLGLGDADKLEEVIPEIDKHSKGSFDLTTFRNQNAELIEAMETFERLVGTTVTAPADRAAGAEPAGEALPAVPGTTTTTVASPATGQTIGMDLGPLAGRKVKSVEVRVEFSE